tara:strand:- start:4515 stop:4694 length:180 start_codon:yes stop_codon:yes gene_type:complete
MRVVIPNKTMNKIDDLLKDIHLLKVAITQENKEKLEKRIVELRRSLLEIRKEVAEKLGS